MNDPSALPASSFRKPVFWLVCSSILFASFFGTLALNIHPIAAIALTLACVSLLLIRQPLFLLGVLLIARMSLDHLSESVQFVVNDTLSLTLSQLLGAFLLLVSIAVFALFRHKLTAFPLQKAFFVLLGMEILLSLWSIDPLHSLQEIARLISIFSIGFLAFVSVTSPGDVKKILALILFSGIIPILEAIRQTFLEIGLSDNVVDIPRIYGTFAHPNVLALFLYSLCVVLTLFLFLPQKTHDKPTPFKVVWMLAALSSCCILLVLTYTRVAWIALFLFALAIAFWRFRIFLFPLIAAPILLIVLVPSVQERFFESFRTNADSSVVWRQEIWRDVTAKLRMDGKHYFGTGTDTFSLYAEQLRGIRFGSTDSHNDFVKFFVEGGWFGLSVFIAYLGLLAKEIGGLFSLPSPYRDLAIVFSFYAGTLLLASLSDNVYKDTPIQWIFFILFGALLALKHIPVPPTQDESSKTA